MFKRGTTLGDSHGDSPIIHTYSTTRNSTTLRYAYQRDPPRPPPPPPLRPRPPPPPPPAGFGRASLTFNARPFISAPLSCAIAVSASRFSVISTKANPRG